MPAPQIKHDLNRSGWETTDFPSVCESCLPENPYVKMLKDDYGAECKLCTRPFTVFAWNTGRARGGKKRSTICLTCARLKNCCQCCMLDLSFGLPIAVRDAALKMVAPGPQSDINREYFAQNNEKAIEEGRAGLEEYEKTDEKARELLRRLATSKPYFRKGRAVDESEIKALTAGGSVERGEGNGGPGPIRTNDTRAASVAYAAIAGGRGGRGGRGALRGGKARQAFPPPAPPTPTDWLPPADKNIMSIFVTGVEDDLPEFKVREFFKAYGKIKSLVCSHMSHCAFVNYETRAAAEKAADACKGRAVIAGCPLRVRWGIPRAIGDMDREQRGQMLADARIRKNRSANSNQAREDPQEEGLGGGGQWTASSDAMVVPAPPGADEPSYASLAGE